MKFFRFFLIFSLLGWISITAAQDNPRIDEIKVTISNATPYLGQQLIYTVTYYAPAEATNIQLQLPDFVGFAQKNQPISQTSQQIENQQASLIQQQVLLHPNLEGTQIINPATINIPETPFQAGQMLVSDPISLTVQALPPNPPDTFTGAVGQFDLSTSLDKAEGQSGEPITLEITLTGSGNFDQILSPSHRLPNNWQISSRPPHYQDINAQVQSKNFYWQFIPNQIGELSLPAIIFSYFDPNSASYRTLTSNPLSLTISGEAFQALSTSQRPSEQIPLKPITSIQTDNPIPDLFFWLLWLIVPILFIIIILVQSTRNRGTSSTPKRSQALQLVMQYLSQAQQSDANTAYRLIGQGITSYLNQIYRTDTEALSLNEVKQLIRNLSPDLQKRLITCLEQADAGQYAPITKQDAQSLLRQTFDTLKQIENEVSK